MESVVAVCDLVQDKLCISADDGVSIFQRIQSSLERNTNVTVDFSHIEMMTAAFLNSAIGNLYGVFDENRISQCVSFSALNQTDSALLKRVTATAKAYHENPSLMDGVIRQILEE